MTKMATTAGGGDSSRMIQPEDDEMPMPEDAVVRLRRAVQLVTAASVDLGALLTFSDYRLTKEEHAKLKRADDCTFLCVEAIEAASAHISARVLKRAQEEIADDQ